MITYTDQIYLDILDDINLNGTFHVDRTGVGTKRIFGRLYTFPFNEFPAVTLKTIAFKNTIRELLFFLSGDCSVDYLRRLGGTAYKWWEPFEKEDGTIGPMYPRQLRNFNGQGLDQVQKLIDNIKLNSNSRRLAITTFNPVEADLGSLWVCHGVWTQFCIQNEFLHMSTTQRSCDFSLGLPHNWISYKILQMLIAHACGLQAGNLVYFINDLHIYSNHLDKILDLPRESFSSPSVSINYQSDINNYSVSDFKLLNYKSGPKLLLPMAI